MNFSFFCSEYYVNGYVVVVVVVVLLGLRTNAVDDSKKLSS